MHIQLYRISAPHFCTGLDISNDIVVEAAPIIKYMLKWHINKVLTYIKNKGWEIEKVEHI